MRPALVGLWITVVGVALLAGERSGLVWVPWLERVERASLDLRHDVRGPQPVADEIVLVGFDDRTQAERPELFERRAGQAELIRALSDAGAAVIGLDVLFVDREQMLSPALVHRIDATLASDAPDHPAMDLLEEIREEVSGDDELIEAIDHADNVVLAMHVGDRGVDDPGRNAARAKYGQVVAGERLPESKRKVLLSLDAVNRAAARMGTITTYLDATGVVRSVQLGIRKGPSVYVPFGIQLVAELQGIPRSKVAYVGTEGTVRLGDRVVRGDDRGDVLLNWRGAPYTTTSVLDVLAGTAPDLHGKIALVGYDHLAQDAVNTPFDRVPGYYTHATLVDNLLHDDFLRRATPLADALAAGAVGLIVALLFTVGRRVRPAARVAGAVGVVLGFAVLNQALFAGGVWLHLVGPLLVGVASGIGCVSSAYLREGRRSRELRRTFAHYLSDDLVEELVSDPSRVSLSGERRVLTVVFTDIRSFTGFSERLEPEDLARFLNGYFTPMTRAVLDNDGYVDKFIGDALMAIFGAPVARPEHEADACRAALAMHRALEIVEPLAVEVGVELSIGVGINTGEMVVGNMGSEERFDYTVLGDAVNVASRLEGLTKQYDVFCLVGPDVVKGAGPGFTFRAVDVVRVKGKSEPVLVYELCGGEGTVVVSHDAPEEFAAGLRAYRAGDLDEAERRFRHFAKSNPLDSVVQIFLERLDALGGVAPVGWDGVFTSTRK